LSLVFAGGQLKVQVCNLKFGRRQDIKNGANFMTTSDTNPSVAGDGVNTLSVDDVKKIITEAQNTLLGASDPVSVAMQIFSGLGNQVTASGATLLAALTASAIPLAGPLATVMAAIQKVTKSGDLVSVTSSQDTQAEINGTPLRLKKEVTFNVTQGGMPALSNITGVAAHKVFWIDIHSIELKQDQGKKIISVVTSAGTREFPVG